MWMANGAHTELRMTEHGDVKRKACEEIADGVFAYLSGNGGPNAAFVVAPDQVLLVDTLMTPRMAGELQSAIRRVTSKPVGITVYTHHHGDHVLGGEHFAPPSVVIAHENCRTRLEGLGQEYIQLFTSWRRTPEDARDTAQVKRVVFPQITFKQEMALHVGDLLVELKYLGPAHTTNDIIVTIPERETLITGDLLAYQSVPGMRDARTAGWIQRLEELEALAPRTILPGHGPWTEDKSLIREAHDFLAAMWQAAQAGFEAGAQPRDVLDSLDLSPWQHFHGIGRAHEALARMYEELAGKPDYDTSALRQPAPASL